MSGIVVNSGAIMRYSGIAVEQRFGAMQLDVRSGFPSRRFAAAIVFGCKNPAIPPLVNC